MSDCFDKVSAVLLIDRSSLMQEILLSDGLQHLGLLKAVKVS